MSVMVRTTSVAVTPMGIEPESLKPTTLGMSINTGCPSIAASASMPPTPQPSTPRPLTIVVCESVPTHRSEEHTSELQSLMRISYAVFRLQKKTQKREEHL